jgi:hypothetical protein
MPSSNGELALVFGVSLLAASAVAPPATAQPQQPQGFAVERFYPSAPGGGWFVMDDLDMRGGLGGAMAMTAGYARDPLQVGAGSQPLAVVSDQAFADFGFAATYDRFRLYLNMEAPLFARGESGTIGGYQFTAPCNPMPDPSCALHHIDLGTNPDTLTDARVGMDARFVGDPKGPFRLGASGQVFFPEGSRTYYDSDAPCSARWLPATSASSSMRGRSACISGRSTTPQRRGVRRGASCSSARLGVARCPWAQTARWRSS